ncbi:MAG: hypothetical protein IPP33_15835 [Flavobacteriales bacterium]|nr:hypothetical protein [Flavobacteriales bacterium]
MHEQVPGVVISAAHYHARLSKQQHVHTMGLVRITQITNNCLDLIERCRLCANWNAEQAEYNQQKEAYGISVYYPPCHDDQSRKKIRLSNIDPGCPNASQ